MKQNKKIENDQLFFSYLAYIINCLEIKIQRHIFVDHLEMRYFRNQVKDLSKIKDPNKTFNRTVKPN